MRFELCLNIFETLITNKHDYAGGFYERICDVRNWKGWMD